MHYSLIFSFEYYYGNNLKAKGLDKFEAAFLNNNNTPPTVISLKLLFGHFEMQFSLVVTKY